MYKNDGVTRRYSESFKLKILAELSTGKFSKRQLSRVYGIQSSTINEWIKKYDRKDWFFCTKKLDKNTVLDKVLKKK